MKLWVGVTDGDWYELLASQPTLEEVNFWQPGGGQEFKALAPGALFLFKLHSPRNFVVGGGVFAHWSRLPLSLAWETFGIANGATSLSEMRRRVGKYRRGATDDREDSPIGCILLEQPFFFPRDRWIPAPADWKPNIVQGKGYALDSILGRRLWEDVRDRLERAPPALGERPLDERATGEPVARFGEPTLVRPRLGQGTFRVLVTDAYERRCAITRERTLPALEAGHIRPYSEQGEHAVSNGLLLRRDLHALFDRGYLTVTPELRLAVSRRIRQDFENGRDYYALDGREVWVPSQLGAKPDPRHLAWHNENRYLA
ncbi:MAG TPA: HNH endonuclease [Candidatus Polarisedimenticolaceae bacterium]|nr:HNH endonuclease [Candidatus Polarisedimenticolaceae bacterium]